MAAQKSYPAAKRSYQTPEARGGGQEKLSHVQGAVAAQAQEGPEELLHVQGRGGSHEEMFLLQGKEQRLHFAGAALKRELILKIRQTQVR